MARRRRPARADQRHRAVGDLPLAEGARGDPAVVAAPAKFVHDEEGRRGSAICSLVSNDCIVSGATARRSLLMTGVKMGSFSSCNEAVILPHCNIGRGAKLSRVIVDAGVRIPEGLIVGEDPVEDAVRFHRSSNGVCLITKPMIERLGNCSCR